VVFRSAIARCRTNFVMQTYLEKKKAGICPPLSLPYRKYCGHAAPF